MGETTVVTVQKGSKVGLVIKEVFGQFITTQFWKGVLSTLVHEAIKSFLITLGGVLVYYGKKHQNAELAQTIDNATGSGQSSTSSRAFGGGFSPQPSYTPSSAYPVSSVPSGDSRFPGFGPR